MPPRHRPPLTQLSRDRRFLIRAGLIISIASCIIALVVSLISPAKRLQDPPRELDTLQEPQGFDEWVQWIRSGHYELSDGPVDARIIGDHTEENGSDPAEPSGVTDAEAKRIHLLDLGLRLSDPDTAIAKLHALPVTTPFRNEFIGDTEFARENYAEAARFYRKELINAPHSDYSRRSAVVAEWRRDDPAVLRDILSEPGFAQAFSPGEQLDLFTDARDFVGLWRATVRFEIERARSPLLLITALFSGSIWFLILYSFWTGNRMRWFLSILAVFAGVVSTALTIYFVMIQERMLGFSENPAAGELQHFIYYVAGVALREEALKLLCFLPFAIWTGIRGRYLDGILLAAFVGLGLAFKENFQYFLNNMDSFTAWTRFFTANVLHFSLTGIAGYYLVKTIHRKFHGVEQFAIAFIGVVFAHGIYNSLLTLNSLESYSALHIVVLAIIAYQFFTPLRAEMDTASIAKRISPLGTFVIGSALLAGGLTIIAAWIVPYREALGVFAMSISGLIPLAFAYISHFRDL